MKRIIATFFVCLLVFSIIASCATTLSPSQENAPAVRLPTIRNGKVISLSTSDAQNIKVDYFGYEMTLYQNSLELKKLAKTEGEVYPDLEDDLIKAGWRLDSDIIYHVWKNGNQYVVYYFLDNLKQETIDFLRRSYGIQDVEVGKTLLFIYVYDKSVRLPDPTATAKAVAWHEEQTQIAVESTRLTIERNQAATQSALEEFAQATLEAQKASAQATTIAQQAEQEAQKVAATAQALQPILKSLGTEFDGENSLATGMKIVREDPSRWDLTTRPGWLHIRGRYTSFSSENWIPKNIFLMPMSYNNFSVITRVDADMDTSGQSTFISLTPNDYRSNGFVVQLGLALGNNKGRVVYAWACGRNSCSYPKDFDFSDSIQFNGPVYLRMDIQSNVYTFYYGEDGVNWTYLGEASGFAAGDKLFLAAGGGDSFYKDREFDAYFDFLHFEAITEN